MPCAFASTRCTSGRFVAPPVQRFPPYNIHETNTKEFSHGDAHARSERPRIHAPLHQPGRPAPGRRSHVRDRRILRAEGPHAQPRAGRLHPWQVRQQRQVDGRLGNAPSPQRRLRPLHRQAGPPGRREGRGHRHQPLHRQLPAGRVHRSRLPAGRRADRRHAVDGNRSVDHPAGQQPRLRGREQHASLHAPAREHLPGRRHRTPARVRPAASRLEGR